MEVIFMQRDKSAVQPEATRPAWHNVACKCDKWTAIFNGERCSSRKIEGIIACTLNTFAIVAGSFCWPSLVTL